MNPSPVHEPRWHHRVYVGIQHLIPQHGLSSLMHRLARMRWRPAKDLLIRGFIRHFGVDMEEAAAASPAAYSDFNDFFTRALRPGARPIAGPEGSVVSPADGVLSQIGTIARDSLVQAKGHIYRLDALLGPAAPWAPRFMDGGFATIYLSPRDYHRVHMPLAATARETVHVPGRLFSVNAVTAGLVPGLYARNERVVCLFDTARGPMALILVGAIGVGGIETRCTKADTVFERGEEMGRFNLGSTVILLLPPGMGGWLPSLGPGDRVRVGQVIGG